MKNARSRGKHLLQMLLRRIPMDHLEADLLGLPVVREARWGQMFNGGNGKSMIIRDRALL